MDTPDWVVKILGRMGKRRRRSFIYYIDGCINLEKFIRYQKIGTTSINYGIEQPQSSKFQYMPLSGMVEQCKIINFEPGMKKWKIGLGYNETMKIRYEFKPYRIFDELHIKNKREFVGSTHGLSISTNLWRYQNLQKQRRKIFKMMNRLRGIRDKTLEFRKVYRRWISEELLRRMITKKFSDQIDTMYKYSREHKGSKWTRGIRWGTMSVEECKVVAWADKQAVIRLKRIIDDLPDDLTIVWDLKVGFGAIRTRSELTNFSDQRDFWYKSEEEYEYSRDARSLGFLSHMFGLLKKEEIRIMEKWLIIEFARIAGIKVHSPLINNSELWQLLKDRKGEFFGYDGSNWQAVVGIILGSPISLIFYGWQLLCSGANTTSLEGILTMIMVVSTEWPDVEEMVSFGDDIMIDVDKELGVENLIVRGEKERATIFLGYDVIWERAVGLKICLDDSTKMKTAKTINEIKWEHNVPGIQKRVQLLIIYGFMDTTNALQLNIDSKEFLKPSRILLGIEPKVWSACIDEYYEKFKNWW